MNEPFEIKFSAIDEARFGIRTAKAILGATTDIPALLDFCRANRIELAIVRCSTLNPRIAQALEGAGFFLTDTLVYFRRDLARKPIPPDTGTIAIRPVRPGEETTIGRVAAEAFHNYQGHYHADPRLDQAKCDEVYVDWAIRSCTTPGVADVVLVADNEGEIVGFTTLRLESPDAGAIWLAGMVRAAQGKGVNRSLQIQGMNWLRDRGRRWLVYSTQISNIAAQKVLARLGYEPSHSYYTFHHWFGTPTL